jgi:predicted kinase
MRVIIPRAGSGAGKSTWLKINHPNAHIVSADKFFMDNGEYKFDRTKLGEAHAACKREFIDFCQAHESGDDDIVLAVDNTNTRLVEFAIYQDVAEAYGHRVEISSFIYDPVAAWQRNTHGTPLDVCMAQHMRLTQETLAIPSWWGHNYVIWNHDSLPTSPKGDTQ